MKKQGRFIGISVATLALLAVASNINRARAATLDIWVDPTTWAFVHVDNSVPGDPHDDPEDGSWTNVVSFQVTGINGQGRQDTRYYFAGGFTGLNVWNNNVPTQLLQSLACNNIFYTHGTTAYALDVNGGGFNGTDGEVIGLHALNNGDLILTGNFNYGGNLDHTQHFTCYKFADGWLGDQGIEVDAKLD